MKKCPHCNKPLLSPVGKRVLLFVIRKRTVRVDDVMKELGLSPTSANNYLRELWVTNFINRKSEKLPFTGGLRFIYTVRKKYLYCTVQKKTRI